MAYRKLWQGLVAAVALALAGRVAPVVSTDPPKFGASRTKKPTPSESVFVLYFRSEFYESLSPIYSEGLVTLAAQPGGHKRFANIGLTRQISLLSSAGGLHPDGEHSALARRQQNGSTHYDC